MDAPATGTQPGAQQPPARRPGPKNPRNRHPHRRQRRPLCRAHPPAANSSADPGAGHGRHPARWPAAWPAHAGIDLTAVAGSGPRGRIVKADVEAADRRRTGPAPAAVPHRRSPADRPGAGRRPAGHARLPTRWMPNSMRKVIARRLTEAKQTARISI